MSTARPAHDEVAHLNPSVRKRSSQKISVDSRSPIAGEVKLVYQIALRTGLTVQRSLPLILRFMIVYAAKTGFGV